MPANQIPVHPEQSVRLSSHHGIMVREDTAFTNREGIEKLGIRKRTEQALDKLQEPLRKILGPDEAVLYVARAQIMLTGIEKLSIGGYAALLAPAVLVLTNQRLLHLLVTWNGRWKRSMRGARWGDMDEAKVKGLLNVTLNITYRDGRKEIFGRMMRNDAKKIQFLLEALLPHATGETFSALGMTSFCPECRAPLTREVYECANCRMKFKDEKTLLKLSMFIPGGGLFYTGHLLLGMLHAMTDLILILFAVFWTMVALGIRHPAPTPGQAPGGKATALIIVAFMAAGLAFHKWMLIRVTRKLVRNYIPVS
jgi:hypothetical protein